MLKKNYRRFHRTVRSSAPVAYQKAFKHRQIIKFLIAGGMGASVDLFVYFLLTYLVGLWYVASSAISFSVAFWVSFGLQKFWTFRDGDTQRMGKQTALYFFVAIINLGINTLLVYLLVDHAGAHKLLSKIVASAIVAVESFLVYRYVIFAKKELVNI